MQGCGVGAPPNGGPRQQHAEQAEEEAKRVLPAAPRLQQRLQRPHPLSGSNVQRDRVRKAGAGITFGTLETQRPMARSMPMSEMVVPSACISCDAYLRARGPAG
jgi:hypothetical protein